MQNKQEKVKEGLPQKTESSKPEATPLFIEADTMFEKLATLTRDITDRAFDFSRERGGGFGKDLEDWLRAENELLRPAPVEITESDENILVSVAVPGFKPEEIEIAVKDNVLMINGIAEASLMKEGTTIVREWNSNRFCRTLALPSNVVEANVTAKLANGMLELTLPKAAEKDVTKVAVVSA